MTDPGHASDHGDRRAPGNARLSLFGNHQRQRDRTGRGYQEYNYKMSKLRVPPIFRFLSERTLGTSRRTRPTQDGRCSDPERVGNRSPRVKPRFVASYQPFEGGYTSTRCE